MRRVVVCAAIATMLLSICGIASADTYVNGHYRKDGTYVQGHYRSDPNDTVRDNWSTCGNVNPHTGKPGTRDPYGW